MKVFKSVRNTRNLVINAIWIAGFLILLFSPSAKALLLRLVLLTGLFHADLKRAEIVGKTLPQVSTFQLVDADGKLVNLSDFQGKTVFINFWASWCPPCRAEMPSLNTLYLNLRKDSTVVFLFVSEDDDVKKSSSYIKDHGLILPIYTHKDDVPVELFSGTLPTTVILNKKGNIVWRHEGLASYDTESFARQLYNLDQ